MPTKNPAKRAIWLGVLLLVFFVPIILILGGEGREQTSLTSKLLSLTGVQMAGLLVYTAALATRFKSRGSEFGVPLHRWVGTGLALWMVCHVILALASNPDFANNFLIFDATPRAAAGIGAFVCIAFALVLGEFRARMSLSPNQWKTLHVGLAWLSGLLAFSHIVWINQLVNEPIWVILFLSLVGMAFYMWATRAKGVSKTTDGAVPKFVRWVFIVGAVLAVMTTLVSWRYPDFVQVGYTQTETGPVGPADRNMLYKVKQAGLWEMPMGLEAEKRAVTPRLREVGRKMADEHAELNRRVDEVASQLGIPLPNEPTPDQKRWMEQITNSQGIQFDQNAVLLLRMAHGIVLPVLAQVRAGTRNELVRQFAAESIEYVHRHMDYLESTGLLNYADLPESPPPSPYQQPAVANYFDTHDARTLFISFVVISVMAIFITMLVMSMSRTNPLRPKRNSQSTRAKVNT